MRRRSPQPGRRSSGLSGERADGLTLIELLGALALLATLLTAMLSARADAMRQHARAQRKLLAIDYADQLLTTWWPSTFTATSTSAPASGNSAGQPPTDSAASDDADGIAGIAGIAGAAGIAGVAGVAGVGVPRQGSGRHRQWELTWQTATVDHGAIAALGGQVVRLTVRDERLPLSAAPLVSVEVVLPLPLDEASGLTREGR